MTLAAPPRPVPSRPLPPRPAVARPDPTRADSPRPLPPRPEPTRSQAPPPAVDVSPAFLAVVKKSFPYRSELRAYRFELESYVRGLLHVVS